MKNCEYLCRLCVLAGLTLIVFSACGQGNAKIQETEKPVSNTILKDDMGFVIRIGVSDIDENNLRKTLATAADEHQNDPARDYLMKDHLWVEAYLVHGDKQSATPAGRLGRYVPPRNPNVSVEDPNTIKEDQVFITLEPARETLY